MNSSFPEVDPVAPPPAPVQVRVMMPYLVPTVTYVLVGFTIFVYLMQLLSVAVFGYAVFNIGWLEYYGARFNDAIRAGELWRFITPVFLHGSITHIFFNMYALFSIGSLLEKYYGHARFVLLYFLGAFSGNVFSFLFTGKNGYSLGASTAVFGLVAAEAVFFYQNRKLLGSFARQALGNTAFVIVINLFLIGQLPGIDSFGHVGGLLGGAVFAWFASPIWKLIGMPPDVKLEDEREFRDWVTGAGAVLLIFGAMAIWGMFQ